MPFGIQPWHLVIIVIVALIIFGPSKLPDLGRSFGKTITEFRKGTQEMTQGFKEEISIDDEKSTTQPQIQTAPPAAAIPAQTAVPVTVQPVQAAVAVEAVAVAPAAEEAICPSCGVSNPATARFCLNCGTQIHA